MFCIFHSGDDVIVSCYHVGVSITGGQNINLTGVERTEKKHLHKRTCLDLFSIYVFPPLYSSCQVITGVSTMVGKLFLFTEYCVCVLLACLVRERRMCLPDEDLLLLTA